AVPELGALVLTLHDDARRQVRDAHGGVGGVDSLPSGPRGAEHVDADLVLADVDLDVIDLRGDRHRGEAGLPPAGRVEGRDAHETVDARLTLEIPVGVLAGDLDRRGLDARLFAGQQIDDLGLEADALEPAQ